jgi:thiol-disulfide isomerase/thioredoxin
MIIEVVKPDTKLYNRFNRLLKQGNIIVLYYANWCPHCVNMKPEWDAFKTKCESDPKYSHLKVAEVESEHISNTNAATEAEGFPTIKFYKKNNTSKNIPTEVVDFQEERTVDNLLKFTEANSFKDIEKVETQVVNTELNNKSKTGKKSKKNKKSLTKNTLKQNKTKKNRTTLPKNKKPTKKETAKLRSLVFGKN